MNWFVIPFVLLAMYACTGQRQNVPTTVLSVRDHWTQASAIAQDWRPDAYIAYVSIGVKLPSVPESRSQLEFHARSPNEDYLELVVFCSEDCASIESQEVEYKEGPVAQVSPITLDDFAVDSGEAFEIALQRGGDDYVYRRADQATGRTIFATLLLSRELQYEEHTLRWIVLFGDMSTSEETNDRLDVVIDSITGEVIAVNSSP
jgi:hypothetical protein